MLGNAVFDDDVAEWVCSRLIVRYRGLLVVVIALDLLLTHVHGLLQLLLGHVAC